MKVILFDFQEDALNKLHRRLLLSRNMASIDVPQAISFSAPTGSGKTIVMTALFETILHGAPDFQAQPDAVIVWISDLPELNAQTRLKIEGKSDRIRVRQLITIDSRFDAEFFTGGHIYFINTQKLGTDKLLTRPGDNREHTLWETFTNTAKAIPDRFYVVIDEAHRGMRRTEKDLKRAQTILQRFLLGSKQDGLSVMPMVLGMSATPRRFEDLLAGTTHTVHKVYVSSEDVRESGLLKDRILIHYPDSGGQAEMTLLSEATGRWHDMERRWAEYCNIEDIDHVHPILVIQVEDGTDNVLSKTDLVTALATLENSAGREIEGRELAHTFHDRGEIAIGNSEVRYVEASRIEDDPDTSIVLFKMSLSTGWDCPRAEVMMSFRRAQDHTYIAQLLGRMVRTPLAWRVETDAELNDVHLYLPHFDEEAVDAVIEDLRNVEDVPPVVTGTSRELVTLQRRDGAKDVLDAMQELVTYRVDAVRDQSALRRLMGLGRGLTNDQIESEAQAQVTSGIVSKMEDAVRRLRKSGDLDELAEQITGIDLKTISVQGVVVIHDVPTSALDAASADIDRYFAQAGRLFSNGLHREYWTSNGDRNAVDVKVEVIALSQDHASMQEIEEYALKEFDRLYQKYKIEISRLKDQRRQHFNRLRLSTSEPQSILWHLPESIPFSRSPDAEQYDKHLYHEADGSFKVDLGNWEKQVLEEELDDPKVVAWLRNVDRQPWALEIPYRKSGAWHRMFPDMLIVRNAGKGFLFDILEPHDPSRSDNVAKAVGLAEFAEKHWDLYDRIQLIRKMKAPVGDDYFYRLDVGEDKVRRKVLPVSTDHELDGLFENEARIRGS